MRVRSSDSGGYAIGALIVAIVAGSPAASGCARSQLLAPTNSTIIISTPNRVLAVGGSTDISAQVTDQNGAAVPNGTIVRFTASLGTVNPFEAETRNGLAVTTFTAGTISGVAEVRATSGGSGSAGTGSATNVLQITIGAAAVNTVTLRANPPTVAASGGVVELIASVAGENGRALNGIAVTFTADRGTLNPATATTNGDGEARTNLSTSLQTVVVATAGTKSSPNVTISLRAGSVLSIACAPAAGAGICTSIQASTTDNLATVIFTVAKGSGSTNLQTSTIDFGDNASQSLGNLGNGSATATHSYAGPTGTAPRSYTATVQATDVNGEAASVATTVIVTARALAQPLAVAMAASPGSSVAGVGNTTSLTATVTPATGGADMVASYTWDFGDGATATTTSATTTHIYTTNGAKTATVAVRTTDGRTATGRAEFIIVGI